MQILERFDVNSYSRAREIAEQCQIHTKWEENAFDDSHLVLTPHQIDENLNVLGQEGFVVRSVCKDLKQHFGIVLVEKPVHIKGLHLDSLEL